MSGFIAESALLTHGIASVSNSEIMAAWQDGWKIAWMDAGRLVVGEIDEFCRFRDRAADFRRINYFSYDKAADETISGPLTASGTMRACEETGALLAVSCGIGGLRTGEPISACNDIMAMKDSKISLLATAFKDMFDACYSIESAGKAGISVVRGTANWHTGYLFAEADHFDLIITTDAEPDSLDQKTPLDTEAYSLNDSGDLGFSQPVPQEFMASVRQAQQNRKTSTNKLMLENRKISTIKLMLQISEKMLILCPVPATELISDRHILEEALVYGKEQAALGRAFHPAVNRKIDELTGGYSSRLQLRSLAANMQKAEAYLEALIHQ